MLHWYRLLSTLSFLTFLATPVFGSEPAQLFLPTGSVTLQGVPSLGYTISPRGFLDGHQVKDRNDISFEITLPGLGAVRCSGTKFSVLQPGAPTVQGTDIGDVAFVPDRHFSLWGRIEGLDNSFFTLTIFERYAVGYFETIRQGQKTVWIMAPDSVDGEYRSNNLVFNSANRKTKTERSHCSAEELPGYQRMVDEHFERIFGSHGTNKHDQPLGVETVTATVGIDCDFRYFQAHGSNLSRAANYALIVMSTTSAIYLRDCNVKIEVPYLRVWTTNGHPYVGPNLGDILGQLRTFWNNNMGFVDRSLGKVYTTFGGGLAWVGVLCGGFGYSASGLGNGINFPADSYLWDVDVNSHELGHNFGSPHTHNCSWAPAIDSCWDAEGGCYPERVPKPGTIMSYCHLNAGTLLNIHPRVATLIRNSAERAACVRPERTFDRDIAITNIVVPANGGTISNDLPFRPVVKAMNRGLLQSTGQILTLTITNSTGTDVFTGTRQIPPLNPGVVNEITFDEVRLRDIGLHQITASIAQNVDDNNFNNRLSRPFETGSGAPRTVQVLSPNGGEILEAGAQVEIRWSQQGVQDVAIDLSIDNGATWSVVRTQTPATSGSLAWTVPAVQTMQALIRVRNWTNSQVVDQSDRPFSIGVRADVQPQGFAWERDETFDAPWTPQIVIRNNGNTEVRQVPVQLTLTWNEAATLVYDRTIVVPSVKAFESITVDFPAFEEPPGGLHVVRVETMLDGDQQPANDRLSSEVRLRGVTPPIGPRLRAYNKTIALEWLRASDPRVDTVVLYRGEQADSLAEIARFPQSVRAFVDTGLVNGRQYFYGLRSLLGGELSRVSALGTITPHPIRFHDTLRGSPKSLSPANDALNTRFPLSLVWSVLNSADIYEVQVAEDAQFQRLVRAELRSDAQPVLMDIAPNVNHFWRVRGINGSGPGPWSPANRFTSPTICGERAAEFNGVNTNVEVENFEWNGGPVTVEFWNYVSRADLRESSAFAVGQTDNLGNRFQSHTPWINGVLHWSYGNFNDGGNLTTDYSPYFDRWVHVALVSNSQDFMGIYINGELVARSSTARNVQGLRNLTIGNQLRRYFHKGTIDEFRIWKEVRSQEQILRYMNDRILVTEPNLVTYWRFNEADNVAYGDAVGARRASTPLTAPARVASLALLNCTARANILAPNLVNPPSDRNVVLSKSPKLSWLPLAAAEAWQIEIDDQEDFSSPFYSIVNHDTTVFQAPPLLDNRLYYWRVRGFRATGVSPWTNPSVFRVSDKCEHLAPIFGADSTFAVVPGFKWNDRAVTVEFWNFVDSASIRQATAFSIGPRDETSNRFQAHVPWSDRTLYWDYGNQQNVGRISANYGPYIGKWTHVALVADGYGSKSILLDGRVVASSPSSGWATDLDTLFIGSNHGNRWAHRGRISDFRVWNKAKTELEVRRDMFRRLVGSESGLVAYYKLDGGEGQPVVDVSRSQASGAFRGSPRYSRFAIPLVFSQPSITGRQSIRQRVDTAEYSVPFEPGYVYRWTVQGGQVIGSDTSATVMAVFQDTIASSVRLVRQAPGGCIDSSAMPVGVRFIPLSVGERASEVSLVVTPNPASDVVELTVPDDRDVRSVQVYNLAGEQVAELTGLGATSGAYRIGLDMLASGAYTVVVRLADNSVLTTPLYLVR